MFKITHFPQTDFQFNNFRVIDGSMKDMLKKFNTTETWIDVETLANLKGVSKRAIRLSLNSKNSNYENGCYRTSLNENEIKIFLNILLSPNKFSVGRAISLTQYILKEKNAEYNLTDKFESRNIGTI